MSPRTASEIAGFALSLVTCYRSDGASLTCLHWRHLLCLQVVIGLNLVMSGVKTFKILKIFQLVKIPIFKALLIAN